MAPRTIASLSTPSSQTTSRRFASGPCPGDCYSRNRTRKPPPFLYFSHNRREFSWEYQLGLPPVELCSFYRQVIDSYIFGFCATNTVSPLPLSFPQIFLTLGDSLLLLAEKECLAELECSLLWIWSEVSPCFWGLFRWKGHLGKDRPQETDIL